MRRSCWVLYLVLLLCSSVNAQTHRQRRLRSFEATAYTRGNITASGEYAQRGLVAADTRILPLGTRIQVRNAGPYSGNYTVADTGSEIHGHRIDIFVPNRAQAKRFGRKTVQVRVLRWGEGRKIASLR